MINSKKIIVVLPAYNAGKTIIDTYAEIPFTAIYDEEVLSDQLVLYDWLHLHHEDFTGQYGKFYGSYRNAPWYIEQKKEAESLAQKLGFSKVSQETSSYDNGTIVTTKKTTE